MVRKCRAPSGPGAVERRTGRKAGSPETASPPGAMRSKPMKHRARDALGFGGLAALQELDKPRCREASRPVGPSGPLASRAPSFVLARRQLLHPDGVPGAAKKQGDDACLGFGCLKIELVQPPLIPAQAGIQHWVPACAGTSGRWQRHATHSAVMPVGCLKSETVQQPPLIPAQAGIQHWVPACAGASGRRQRRATHSAVMPVGCLKSETVQQPPLIPAQAGIQHWVPACAGTSGRRQRRATHSAVMLLFEK